MAKKLSPKEILLQHLESPDDTEAGLYAVNPAEVTPEEREEMTRTLTSVLAMVAKAKRKYGIE